MQLGDRVQVQVHADTQIREPVMATVIYIHPQHRYYVAEYQYHPHGQKLRESFLFPHRRGNFKN